MNRLIMPFYKAIFLIIIIMTVNCGQGKERKLQFLVSPKGYVSDFWIKLKAGADSAGRDLGVDIIWNGPTLETDIAGQVAIVENYINKRVDAIILAACDTKALVPVVEKADAQGIPVIIIDSGLDSDIPKSYIATDNVLGAEKAADVLAELIDGRGKVACISFVPGAATSIMREAGFQKGIAKYPDIVISSVQHCQSDVALAMSITENILTAHPDLAGIFATTNLGAIGAAQAIVARGMKGKVKLVAFDASPNEVEALRKGVIQGLIVQHPFRMGYEGVKTAYDILQGKPVEKRLDTGVYVLNSDNVDDPNVARMNRFVLEGR